MSWSLPYARGRRYLTGADWLVGMLDHTTRQACGVGNTSQVVLELESRLPEAELRARLSSFLERLPFLWGAPARDWNLAPYWRKRPAAASSLPLVVERLPEDAAPESVLAALTSALERPLGPQRLAFTGIALGERRAFLAMAFDHWLLDGRGAELLLALFLEHLDGRPIDDRLALLDGAEPPHLDRWIERHRAGRRVLAHLRWLRERPAAVLPRPPRLSESGTHFARVTFAPDEAQRVKDAAYREAGYLMVQSFLLAAVLQALHPLFERRRASTPAGAAATDYVVPVSVDLRPLRGAEPLVFFNHLSFVLFRVPVGIVGERPRLAAALRDQMVAQVKAGLPQDIAEASDLLRILPIPWLARLARLPMAGAFGSFSFAALSSDLPRRDAETPWPVANLFHLPRMPLPPGFGVVANQFAGRMNLVLSAHEEIVSRSELAEAAERLRALPASCESPRAAAVSPVPAVAADGPAVASALRPA